MLVEIKQIQPIVVDDNTLNKEKPEELKEVYDLYKKSIELCNDFRIGYFNTIEVLAEMSKTKYGNDHEIVKYLEFYNSKWGKRSNLLAKGGEAKFRLGKIEESFTTRRV